jgi:hypothetical protein
MTTIYTPWQANTLFHKQLDVLSVSLSDQERKELIAQWAMMETKADFDAIEARMSSFAKEFGLKLPVIGY